MFLIVGIVALLGFIGYMLYLQKQKPQVSAVPAAYQTDYQKAAATIAPIEKSSDLSTASTSLDSEDTTKIDTELKALNSASAGF